MRYFKRLIPFLFTLTAILIMVFNDDLEDTELDFTVLFFISTLVLMIWWLVTQIRSILTLKKEKKVAELLHLKSQVNPHFFFNTLNNLYGLVGQDNTKAHQIILRLSDMMRYSIYEGQKDWVTLADEITYIENYLDLHRMRYHKSIDIRFIIEAEDRSIKIMPLLFIIMVENAFKHGVEKLRSGAFVYIQLTATKQFVDFEIENNFDVEETDSSEGIGLKNLKQRLELVYANKYELEVSPPKTDLYKIKLRIRL